MIDVARYQLLTGDTASAAEDVEAAIDLAVDLLEEYLDRPLLSVERTEAMRPDRTGRLWPKATPLATVDDGYEIDGLAIVSGTPFFPVPSFLSSETTIEVTYTGGWAAQDDTTPDAPVIPMALQRDIAHAAHRILHPNAATTTSILPGADAMQIGDASVSGKRLGRPDNTDSWWSDRTRGYRWTGPLGVPA